MTKPPPRARVDKRTNHRWSDQQVGFYYAVVAALLQAGCTQEHVGKVGGGNFGRVFKAATVG